MQSDHARYRAEAEALFKKKEDASREASRAREVYPATERAMREKTARLRALRLARDQAKQLLTLESDRARTAASQSGKKKRAVRFPSVLENGHGPAQRPRTSE